MGPVVRPLLCLLIIICLILLIIIVTVLRLTGTISDEPTGYGAETNGTSNHDPIEPPTVTCVYPISGQYGFLPRLLYYILIAFGVAFRHHDWLVAGALASALTYAASASIHVLLLAGFSLHAPAYDLDAVACAAITGAAVAVIVPLLRYSDTWKWNAAKIVVMLWAGLVTTGLICSTVSVWRQSSSEPPCINSAGELLKNPTQYLLDTSFNCTYKCFSSTQHFRNIDELQAVLSSRFEDPISFKALVAAITVIAGVVAYYLFIDTWLCWPCFRAARGSYNENGLWSRHGLRVWVPVTGLIFLANCVPFEIGIQWPEALPMSEDFYAVGQWAPWVVAALVVIAAVIARDPPPEGNSTGDNISHEIPNRNTSSNPKSRGDPNLEAGRVGHTRGLNDQAQATSLPSRRLSSGEDGTVQNQNQNPAADNVTDDAGGQSVQPPEQIP